MGLRINLNTSAVQAHRTLQNSDSAMGKSIERLSSGFRINNAGDDPAGLVISQKLRAQVGGLAQAVKNAGDAVNMVKTAEGALNEVHSLLRSMRDLAVHAANTGANDTATVAADQSQITSAIESINKIAAETKFGTKTLLDGSAGIKAVISGSSVSSASFSTALTADADVYVDVTTAAAQATLATKASATTSAEIFHAAGLTVTINAVDVAVIATDDYDDVVTKINAVTDQTGVTAAYNAGTDAIDLTSQAYGSTARINITSGTDFLASGATAAAIGVDTIADVSSDGAATALITGDLSWDSGTGLTIQSTGGDTIVLTTAGGSAVADLNKQLSVVVGTLTFQVGAFANQTRTLNIASVASANLGDTAVGGETLATVDVTSQTGAQNAILILDEAIGDISTQRASLGSTQKNTLESSINSLSIARENIAASESSIRDTDMAAEMVLFVRNQIMMQAGVAMLAQANQAPQALLTLLR